MTTLLPSQQKQHHDLASKQQRRSKLSGGRNSKSKWTNLSTLTVLVLCATCSVVAFYGGMLLGSIATQCIQPVPVTQKEEEEGDEKCFTSAQVKELIQEAVKKQALQSHAKKTTTTTSRDTDPRFSHQLSNVVVGMTRVDRDEFTKTFDLGVPLDNSDPRNKEVLLLYANEDSMPSDPFQKSEAKSQTAIPKVTAEEATQNCNSLHIVLQDHSGRRKQCTAVLGQYEAFHIQKLMRLATNSTSGAANPALPLTLVNRGAQESGRRSITPPTKAIAKTYWSSLYNYLGILEDTLQSLEPIAKRIAVNQTIVVQVVNFGQSELLLNFLCSAKRRGLDTSSILVFATDQETFDLVNHMGGATVVYLKDVFGEMPSRAANHYGDMSFRKMMLAKVYCIHLVMLLGYDVLFQDVDVIWYQNPIPYFHNSSASDASFDVYFQDDGNHASFYAPYSANTGFYYARNNERTVHFFNSLLVSGDSILQMHSHQITLVALLQEHASLYGLKIKIFSRDGDLFPGGHAYHRRRNFMKEILTGQKQPYIFHMSWTESKVNKINFYQQLGEWYLADQCTSKSLGTIYGTRAVPDDMTSDCCAAKPTITCHYRDKPSKIPCTGSPNLDAGIRSFW